LKQLIETVEHLHKRQVNLVSLTEHIDTTTATGRLFFQCIAMLAEYERNLISERTKAGLEAARARGRVGGRPRMKPTDTEVVVAKQLHASNTPLHTILKTLNIKKSTFYRYLKMSEEETGHVSFHEGPRPLFATGSYTPAVPLAVSEVSPRSSKNRNERCEASLQAT
jgi:DNA invertase Pin-like site-specific DNA recombinase